MAVSSKEASDGDVFADKLDCKVYWELGKLVVVSNSSRTREPDLSLLL